MKGIKYIGPLFDGSGYAEAARGNVMALHKLGVPITLAPISFETVKLDHGKHMKVLEGLVGRKINYDTVIIHCTPEWWMDLIEPGKQNIGMTIWETTKLHPVWAEYINNTVDKVIVGCEWNVGVFKNSGVEVPIYAVPHCIDINDIKSVRNKTFDWGNKFVFYSIFQWTYRKNPTDLIVAYWYAFQNHKDTLLVLKTYKDNYNDDQKKLITDTIQSLSVSCPMAEKPDIFYLDACLSRKDILSLHKRGDCYVSLDRGEGFGLSGFTAGAMGNPIIVTDFGGAKEYAKEDNSYLVDCSLVPVYGMPHCPWYRGDQLWASPDVLHAAQSMRDVYYNRSTAIEKGQRLKNYIRSNFSPEIIGQKIIDVIDKD